MALISGLAAVVLPVFLLSALGYLWGLRRMPFDHLFVAQLVTIVGSPCLIFSTLSKVEFPPGEVGLMAAATCACLVLTTIVGVVALKLAGLPQRIYLPSLVFPNVGNMGLPVCLFAFGDQGLALAMIYFAVTTGCQFTVGPPMASGRWQLSALLKVPFVYAVGAAFVVQMLHLPVPQWLANTASLTGGLAIPLMLIALGVALAELKIANLPRALAMSVGRLLLGFLTGWVIATLFRLDGAMRAVAMIQSAMPVAVFNYMFARLYGTEPEEVAGIVLLSTVLSYATMPLVVGLVL